MMISERGLALICRFEDCRLEAYPDPATGSEPWTIGYGCTEGVKRGDKITQAQALEMLKAHMAQLEAELGRLIKVPVTQAQWDAIVSFCWNVGVGNFSRSSVLKDLNGGHPDRAADSLQLWVKASGRVMPGLILRRQAERELFLRG